MRSIALATLVAAGLTTSAVADVAKNLSPRQDAGPSLSVWRLSDGGDAEHLQSGLACPAQFRGYKRVDLHVYDGFGLDVSCNYTAPGIILTVYLTRRYGMADVDNAMAEARLEFLSGRDSWHPRPISDTRTTDGAVAWRVLLYSDDKGRDGIWIADLDGWTLEYRITNTLAVDSQAQADMAAMTQLVVQSAGARLQLCARSPRPDRRGVAVKNDKDSSATALISAITAAAASNGADVGEAAQPPKPITWCEEQAFPGAAADLLFWRGVEEDGADARADQLTVMTNGPPPTLMVANDPTTARVENELGRPPRWAARISKGDQTSFYGYFNGRPPPETLAALFRAILAGQAHPLSGYNADSRSITIDAPSQK